MSENWSVGCCSESFKLFLFAIYRDDQKWVFWRMTMYTSKKIILNNLSLSFCRTSSGSFNLETLF